MRIDRSSRAPIEERLADCCGDVNDLSRVPLCPPGLELRDRLSRLRLAPAKPPMNDRKQPDREMGAVTLLITVELFDRKSY